MWKQPLIRCHVFILLSSEGPSKIKRLRIIERVGLFGCEWDLSRRTCNEDFPLQMTRDRFNLLKYHSFFGCEQVLKLVDKIFLCNEMFENCF